MMGYHARSEALFYYFRLEDQVPENHLLRLIDQHISFEFVREQLKDIAITLTVTITGRPSRCERSPKRSRRARRTKIQSKACRAATTGRVS